MSEKMFRFTVQNMRTKERTSFIGQGGTMIDELKDGVKNAQAAKSGRAGEDEYGLACKNVIGDIANRTLNDFEGDEPALAYFKP